MPFAFAPCVAKPHMFDDKKMLTYADRLFRRSLLSLTLGENDHPCLEHEDVLLAEAEAEIREWADSYRRTPAWPSLKEWFSKRVMDLILSLLPYYGYPPAVNTKVIDGIRAAGFNNVLERVPSISGIFSPGSNVMSPRKCKTS